VAKPSICGPFSLLVADWPILRNGTRYASEATRTATRLREKAQAVAYRILLVDDEADSREIVARLLELDGYHVETAQDGREALELLAGRSYDLILSDMRMPQMSGEALYCHIEHGWPRLAPRFVFITAERLSRAFQAQYGGGVPVLTKPFTREQIRQVIASVIARAA
jgi:CheY-like chemotaxis protein